MRNEEPYIIVASIMILIILGCAFFNLIYDRGYERGYKEGKESQQDIIESYQDYATKATFALRECDAPYNWYFKDYIFQELQE